MSDLAQQIKKENKEVTSNVALTTLLTEDLTQLRHLEANGDWKSILRLYQGEPDALNRATLKASAAIASGLVSDIVHTRQMILELRADAASLVDVEVKTRVHIAEAALLRRTFRWDEAGFRARRALVLSRRHCQPDLEALALHGVALSLSNLGFQFLAMECYRRIRRQPTVSRYRKSIAAINEAWILWDLGNWRAMLSLLGDVPDEFRTRIELMLALVDGDTSSTETLLRSLQPPLMPAERRHLTLLLLESVFLHGAVLRPALENSWVLAECEILDRVESSGFWSASARAAINGEALDVSLSKDASGWRDALERSFVIFLSRLRSTPAEDLATYYREQIEPTLALHSLNTPLVPSLDALKRGENTWTKQIGKYVFSVPDNKAPKRELSAVLRGEELVISIDGREKARISLERKPQSERILRIISGSSGSEVSKQKIHVQLTGNRYSPALHDDRLQKLLKRLDREIQSAAGISLWRWPGNNSLRLMGDISYEA